MEFAVTILPTKKTPRSDGLPGLLNILKRNSQLYINFFRRLKKDQHYLNTKNRQKYYKKTKSQTNMPHEYRCKSSKQIFSN